MDFYRLIGSRVSVRSYDPERTVAPEVLERVLNAGRLAPSAANRQPWTFHLISSKLALESVRLCYDKPWFQDAPHILAVSGRVSSAWTRKADGYCAVETDCTIAMDHMILAATHEGLGTCWIAAFSPHVLRDALHLDEDEVVFALTPLGYPRSGYTRKDNKQRKNLGEIVRYH